MNAAHPHAMAFTPPGIPPQSLLCALSPPTDRKVKDIPASGADGPNGDIGSQRYSYERGDGPNGDVPAGDQERCCRPHSACHAPLPLRLHRAPRCPHASRSSGASVHFTLPLGIYPFFAFPPASPPAYKAREFVYHLRQRLAAMCHPAHGAGPAAAHVLPHTIPPIPSFPSPPLPAFKAREVRVPPASAPGSNVHPAHGAGQAASAWRFLVLRRAAITIQAKIIPPTLSSLLASPGRQFDVHPPTSTGTPSTGTPSHGHPIHGHPIHGHPIHGHPIHGHPIHGHPHPRAPHPRAPHPRAPHPTGTPSTGIPSTGTPSAPCMMLSFIHTTSPPHCPTPIFEAPKNRPPCMLPSSAPPHLAIAPHLPS
ncbi:unnamed protein product [Closterium sp. NIES-64]|nr:unnamed protein product [Closterium sp. NIES-64]